MSPELSRVLVKCGNNGHGFKAELVCFTSPCSLVRGQRAFIGSQSTAHTPHKRVDSGLSLEGVAADTLFRKRVTVNRCDNQGLKGVKLHT